MASLPKKLGVSQNTFYKRLWPVEFTGSRIAESGTEEESKRAPQDERFSADSKIDAVSVKLHAYAIRFQALDCSSDALQADAEDFVLLVEQSLDNEISSCPIDLFLPHSCRVRACIHPLTPLLLSLMQLEKAKKFHNSMLRAIHSFRETETELSTNEPALQLAPEGFCNTGLEKPGVWSSHKAYLLLSNKELNKIIIAGEGKPSVCNHVFAQGDAKRIFPEGNQERAGSNPSISILNERPPASQSSIQELKDTHFTLESDSTSKVKTADTDNQLILNGGKIPVSELMDTFVTAVHNRVTYVVLSVSPDLTSESRFPVSKYHSFAEYFKIKHGLELKFVKQPLLVLRRPMQAANFLHQKPVESASGRSLSIALMPPELCMLCNSLDGRTIRGAVRLPSIMHRIHCLLLASELRQRFRISGVPLMSVLEALTASGCVEGYSYERYEFLGDAYLRYAVALSLFLTHLEADEIVLSNLLMEQVNNKMLKKLAVEAGIPQYIVSEAFDVTSWEAPGELVNLENQVPEFSTGHNESENEKNGRLLSRFFVQKQQSISVKQIADVVEAIVGLFVSGRGGETETLQFLASIGMKVVELALSHSVNIFQNSNLGCTIDNVSQNESIVVVECGTEVKHLEIGEGVGDQSLLVANPETNGGNFTEQHSNVSSHSAVPVVNNFTFPDRPQKIVDLSSHLLNLSEPENQTFILGVREIESVFAYKFKRPWLLKGALMHPSCNYSNGKFSFERLQFLGGAVLDYLVSHQLFFLNPNVGPGTITILRQAAVNNEQCACIIVRHNLQKYLRVGSPSLEKRISDFAMAVQEEGLKANEAKDEGGDNGLPKHTFGTVATSAPKALSEMAASLAGAIFLDCGLNTQRLWQVFEPLLSPLPEPQSTVQHPMQRLHINCQKEARSLEVPNRRCVHCREYIVEIWINGQLFSRAQSFSVQTSRRLAATFALGNMSVEGNKKNEVLDIHCGPSGCQKLGVGENISITEKKKSDQAIENVRRIDVSLTSEGRESSSKGVKAVAEECLFEKKRGKEEAYGDGREGKRKWWRECVLAKGGTGIWEPNTKGVIENLLKLLAGTSDELQRKGMGRKILNEICSTNGWIQPVYELVKGEGPLHLQQFSFLGRITFEGKEICATGDFCSSHAQAKDSVALKIVKQLLLEHNILNERHLGYDYIVR